MKKNDIKNTTKYFLFFLLSFFLYNIKELWPLQQFEWSSLFQLDILWIALAILSMFFIERQVGSLSKKIKWLIAISILLFVMIHPMASSITIGGYLAFFYFLMLLTFVCHIKIKYSLSLSLGITVTFLLLLFYIIGICDLLILTPWILGFLALLSLGWLGFYYLTKKKNIIEDLNDFLNLEFLLFAMLFFISICSGFGRYVHTWDEYNMWGLNAKKIIINDSLDGFSYPPIMALWYYISHIFTGFSEPNLYMTHTIFIYIYMMSIFSFVKDKKTIPLLLVLLFCLPALFGGVFGYDTLYADYPSSAVFTFGLIYSYAIVKKENNFVHRLMLLLIAVIITLIKPQGFVLATTLLVIDGMIHCVEDYHWKKKTIWKNIWAVIKRYWIYALIPLFMYVMWVKISGTFFVVERFSSPEITPSTLSGTFISEINIYYLLQFCLHVFKFMDTTLLNVANISSFNYLLLTLLAIYGYYWIKEGKFQKAMLKTLPFFCGILCFYFLTTLSMVVMMNTSDALDLVSFSRYLNNFNVGFLAFLFWLLGVKLYQTKKVPYIAFALVTLVIFIGVPMTQSFSFFADMGSRLAQKQEIEERQQKFEIALKYTEENSRIYVIDQQDKEGYQPMCYSLYYLFPRYTNVNGSINWKIQTSSNREEIKDWALDANHFRTLLGENHFNYVLLYSSTYEFFDEIDFMVKKKSDKSLNKYSLFKVVTEDGSVMLEPIA